MIEEKIVRVEIYKKLRSLHRQYQNLPHKDFLCKGAESIWLLQTCIIQNLIERFEKYTYRQLKFINVLFPFFEMICGFLDDSKTKNVPWSIIPSLEDLFAKIKSETKFVICPLWETNYRIFNRNIIEYLDERIISTPGLLFDIGSNFEKERDEFLKQFPSGIYFVFYPRTERLSVLHFPLLGHEIGHIYSATWLKKNCENILKNNNIEEKIKTDIKSEYTSVKIDPIFKESFINIRVMEVIEIYKKILSEIISDLVGAFIFGPAALLSSYIFSLKFGLDDFRSVNFGYLSWRFRLYFLQEALKRMGLDSFPSRYKRANEWLEKIYETSNVNLKNYRYEKKYLYIRHIVELLDSNFNFICEEIESFIGEQKYKTIYNEGYQKFVYDRLDNGILPNCFINEKLEEFPIGLRNIVVGTWQYVCDIDFNDYENFYNKTFYANLLSIKAIELAYFQKGFDKRRYDIK